MPSDAHTEMGAAPHSSPIPSRLLLTALNAVPAVHAAQLLRVIDSLQLAARLPVATPANWHQGEEVTACSRSYTL